MNKDYFASYEKMRKTFSEAFVKYSDWAKEKSAVSDTFKTKYGEEFTQYIQNETLISQLNVFKTELGRMSVGDAHANHIPVSVLS